jgi:hypothetical protein
LLSVSERRIKKSNYFTIHSRIDKEDDPSSTYVFPQPLL